MLYWYELNFIIMVLYAMGLGVGIVILILQRNKDELPESLSLSEPRFCYLQNEVKILNRRVLRKITYIKSPLEKYRVSRECYLWLLICDTSGKQVLTNPIYHY